MANPKLDNAASPTSPDWIGVQSREPTAVGGRV
jgi:hypothetical protein